MPTTVNYRAPEVILHKAHTNEESAYATDAWSIVIVLAQLITGKLPFHGRHGPTILENIVRRLGMPPPEWMDESTIKSKSQAVFYAFIW